MLVCGAIRSVENVVSARLTGAILLQGIYMSLASDKEPQTEHFWGNTNPIKKKHLYDIFEQLMKELKPLGAIKWHTSKTNSIYIKFKDVRLGSIRISDHKGRTQYNYTYELNESSTKSNILAVIGNIKAKSQILSNFNPDNFIVYSKSQQKYIQLNSFNEYKDYILKIKD